MKPILIKANNYRVKCVEYMNLSDKYARLAEKQSSNTFYRTSFKRYYKLFKFYFEKYDSLISAHYTRSQIRNSGLNDGNYLTLGFLRKLDKLKGK